MAILDYSGILNRGVSGAGQTALNTQNQLQGLAMGQQRIKQNDMNMSQQQQQQELQQANLQQTKQLDDQAQQIYQSGDANAIADFSIKNPERAKRILAAQGVVDADGKKRVSDRFSNIVTSQDPVATLQSEIQKGESQGLDMTQSRQILAKNLPPEEIKKAAMVALASVDGDRFKNLSEASSLGGNANLPTESVAFNDLIKDFSPKEKSEARKVKAGLRGRAMSNALLTAIESGDIEAMKKESANMKQAEKFGEMTGSSRAKAIDKGFESINKINSGIGNIDRAIAAVDSGAGVGAVEKLWPSITAASVELDNIRGQMALDVIGSTTFGALSEGELNLAKNIALPTGLDSAELKKYLTDKKVAQEKLRDYYNEQVQFLDQGGTVAGFLRSKEKQASTTQNTAPQSNNQDQQALQWAKSNPNDPRSAQILSKLGVK